MLVDQVGCVRLSCSDICMAAYDRCRGLTQCYSCLMTLALGEIPIAIMTCHACIAARQPATDNPVQVHVVHSLSLGWPCARRMLQLLSGQLGRT